jgi:hypothetical protein
MECSSCKKSINAESFFCTYCGKSTASPIDFKSWRHKSERGLRFIPEKVQRATASFLAIFMGIAGIGLLIPTGGGRGGTSNSPMEAAFFVASGFLIYWFFIRGRT